MQEVISTQPAKQPVGDREAWGQWMLSMHRHVPDSQWMTYTRESYLLLSRFVEYGNTAPPSSSQGVASSQQQPMQQQTMAAPFPGPVLQQQPMQTILTPHVPAQLHMPLPSMQPLQTTMQPPPQPARTSQVNTTTLLKICHFHILHSHYDHDSYFIHLPVYSCCMCAAIPT